MNNITTKAAHLAKCANAPAKVKKQFQMMQRGRTEKMTDRNVGTLNNSQYDPDSEVQIEDPNATEEVEGSCVKKQRLIDDYKPKYDFMADSEQVNVWSVNL